MVNELNLFSSASMNQMNLTEVQFPSTQTLQTTQTWMDLHRHGYGWPPYALQVHTFQSSSAGWQRIALSCPLSCIWRWAGEWRCILCRAKPSVTPKHPNKVPKANPGKDRLPGVHVRNICKMSIFHQEIIRFLTGSLAGVASWKPPNSWFKCNREKFDWVEMEHVREEAVLSTRQSRCSVSRWASPYLSPRCVLPMTCSAVLYWSHQPRRRGCITSLAFIWSSLLTTRLDWVRVLHSHVRKCERITWHWPAKWASIKYH